MKVSKQQFESWVGGAIDNVPEKFREKINNLVFFVKDYPTQEQLRNAKLEGKKDTLLLGLYEGYHQAKRINVGPVFPDKITIFKNAIESLCQTERDLQRQISETVWHEIAHHFGSDEVGARKASKNKK